jgi:diguanylate cyclase (GGDEF)-like protein
VAGEEVRVASSADGPPSRGWALWWGYLTVIFVGSAALIGVSARAVTHAQLPGSASAFVMLAVLLVLGELRPVVASGSYDIDGVSVSTAFVFAILLIWGLAPAVLLQFVAIMMREFLMRKEWWRVLFNAGQYAICLGAAALVLRAFGIHATLGHPQVMTGGLLLAFFVAAVTYHMVNLVLIAVILSIRRGTTLWSELIDEFWYYTSTTMAVIALSPVLAVVAMQSWQMIPLLLLPLFLVYKTASISMEREQQALHDALTGLANRKRLLARTSEVLGNLQLSDGRVALILLDLDRFKDINDTLGHPVGDRVLQVVAARIEQAVRPGDLVARLGGDEFAVLLLGLDDEITANDVAERIRAALHEPISLEGTFVDLDASLGIALFPDHGDDFDQLHRRADVAMYVAKSSGGGVAVYDADKDTNSLARLGVLGELRLAVESGGLELYYQPKVSLATGEVLGVEALVRWQHPTLGLVMPDDFIPLAEQSGLMPRLTDSLLDQALAQRAAWDADGPGLLIAVNVSVRDLLDQGFAERVTAALARHRIPPDALMLEITERRLLADFDRGAKVLAELVASGVHISLDDFGTGYSSLTLLKQLPVCEVKIDQSFVSRIADSEADATIVGSIVELAHALDLTVVAEGVETTEVLQRLLALGCDQAQGWLVGLPMDAATASAWISRHRHAGDRLIVPRQGDPRDPGVRDRRAPAAADERLAMRRAFP